MLFNNFTLKHLLKKYYLFHCNQQPSVGLGGYFRRLLGCLPAPRASTWLPREYWAERGLSSREDKSQKVKTARGRQGNTKEVSKLDQTLQAQIEIPKKATYPPGTLRMSQKQYTVASKDFPSHDHSCPIAKGS